MFGIGMPEMIMILVVALIVIGPKKLPEIAKGLGRAFHEFKKATNDFKESIGIDSELHDVRSAFNDMNRDFKETIDVKPAEQKSNPEPSDIEPLDQTPQVKDTDTPADDK